MPSPAVQSPDWSTKAEDTLCPLCEYNLRGLTEPRCPECGYAFTWEEVLNVRLRKHPYLFEHHPERNVGSFIRTALGGLKPSKFWRELYPSQPSNPRRLFIYFALTMALAALLFILLLLGGLPERQYATYPPLKWAGLFTTRFLSGRELFLPAMSLFVLPLLNVLLLSRVFRFSMNRARVSPMHVYRCIVYSHDIVIVASVILLPILIGNLLPPFLGYFSTQIPAIFGCLAVAAWLISSSRLVFAYRRYLRFHAPLATVAAVQIINLLFVTLLLCIFGEIYWVLPL